MYNSIPSKNFVLFLHEAEYRRLLKCYDKQEKLKDFTIAVPVVGDQINNNNFTEEELFNLNYETMFDI